MSHVYVDTCLGFVSAVGRASAGWARSNLLIDHTLCSRYVQACEDWTSGGSGRTRAAAGADTRAGTATYRTVRGTFPTQVRDPTSAD